VVTGTYSTLAGGRSSKGQRLAVSVKYLTLLTRKDLGAHLVTSPVETPKMQKMMMNLSNGAAASLAYQGGTSGPRGKRNGQQNESHPLSCDDAPKGADGRAMGKDLKLRNTIRIGTWNVRTLMQPGTLELLTREMNRCKVNILGISEMRWSGKGHFSTDDHTIYYSGNEKGGDRGVAFVTSNFISKHVLGYNPVNDRIISIRLQAQPINISLIQVYAPTSSAPDDVLDCFYNQLQDTLDSIPKRDIVMIIGDYNAKIGEGVQHEDEAKVVGLHGLGSRNERGNTLVDFCLANSLTIANTLFQQHPRRKYTWTSPNGLFRNQIDYILVKSRWKTSIKIAKTLPGADIGSDHQLLIADFRIKLKMTKTTGKPHRFDLQNIGDSYRVETANLFQELMVSEEETTPDELWLHIKDSILAAASKHIPKRRKKKTTSWLSQEVVDLADERRQLKEAGLQGSNLYRKISSEVQQKSRRDKNEHIRQLCQDLEGHGANNNSRELFQCVRSLTNKSTARLAIIKDESGKVLTESEEIKDRWKTYCENLYASQEDTSNVQNDVHYLVHCDDEPNILLSEVKEAIRKLKTEKAPGMDDIPSELLKQADDSVAVAIHQLCNKVWRSRTWPEEWKQSVFLTLPKKGDASECKNHRTIALIPHASKILLHIINERLRPHLERELPVEQAGFRKGRGTRDQIANIRHIMEKCLEFQRNIYMCFIDYAKAFDCVRHSALWTALHEMGIPAHLIHLIRNLYDGQAACVRTEKGNSDWFVLGQGVRQGCILSPSLFNLYAEFIMRRAMDGWSGGLSIGGRKVSNLRYADDTTLITTSMTEMAELLNRVKEESERLGLRLNVSKTKLMAIGPDVKEEPFLVDGKEVEFVSQFNFLGSLIIKDGGCGQEIRRRLAMARSAMINLSKIWAEPPRPG
jgi:hypothetical protein